MPSATYSTSNGVFEFCISWILGTYSFPGITCMSTLISGFSA